MLRCSLYTGSPELSCKFRHMASSSKKKRIINSIRSPRSNWERCVCKNKIWNLSDGETASAIWPHRDYGWNSHFASQDVPWLAYTFDLDQVNLGRALSSEPTSHRSSTFQLQSAIHAIGFIGWAWFLEKLTLMQVQSWIACWGLLVHCWRAIW